MPVCNTNLFLSRDVRVFLELDSDIWEIPVLNGYSFSSSTNASTITLAEMSDASGTSRRGQRVLNDSTSPAEWSFDMYMRPTLSTNHYAVEEPLWASMLAAGQTFTAPAWADGVTRSTDKLEFDFDGSNVSALTTFTLYYVFGARSQTSSNFTASSDIVIYRLQNCVVNEATLNFEIDGISTISWSGFGKDITEVASYDATGAITTGLASTSNMIRNRLTALRAVSAVALANEEVAITGITVSSNVATVATADTTGLANGDWVLLNNITESSALNGAYQVSNVIANTSFDVAMIHADGAITITGETPTWIEGKSYNIVLTGGSFTISNNITYLTPETLGIVNTPLEHVTGTRSVSGNFTAYLDSGTNGTIDLYEDLLGATTVITNQFALDFYIGGKHSTDDKPVAPGVQFKLNNAHLEIPSVNVEDVVGVDMNFTALPRNLGCVDEIGVIRYIGV